ELSEIPPAEYTVTFNVTDAATSNAISDAEIIIDGNTLTTNSSGEATVDLIDGNYSYSVNASGYYEATGNVVVNGSDIIADVLMDIDTSIEEFESGITISPNPSTGRFLLLISGVNNNLTVTIYDAKGNVIIKKENQEIIDGKYEQLFDLSSHANGMYYLKVVSENVEFVKKIVVTK
ncbi:MAG: T9SS type A sorting domain-containing protein, partial [Bacteroidota bacterium]|nr:T9SS type A sorting domain-containing protein [Bacteroidota bacterium]